MGVFAARALGRALGNLLGKRAPFLGGVFLVVFASSHFLPYFTEANGGLFGPFGPLGGPVRKGPKTRGEIVAFGPPLRPGGRFWVAFFRSVLRPFRPLARSRVLTPLFGAKKGSKNVANSGRSGEVRISREWTPLSVLTPLLGRRGLFLGLVLQANFFAAFLL